jgi:hypothetical protein
MYSRAVAKTQSMRTALSVQIIVGLLASYFVSSEAGCANISKLGYQVDGTLNSSSCREFGGAWILDCCMPCSVNSLARGSIVVGSDFFPRLEEALSFNYSLPPKMLQLLPGVYPRPGNCESTINYDSVQIIGVCGNAFTKIDCNKSAFHFKITGRNITIQGLTLVNGFSSENGGCIAVTPPATGMTLVDNFLLNCVSYQNGGAISFSSKDLQQFSQSVEISIIGECRIENCSAKDSGGAVYITVASRFSPFNYTTEKLSSRICSELFVCAGKSARSQTQ